MQGNKEKIALVTGASSGIGRDVAMKLAEEGYNLMLTARRKDRLEELSGIIRRDYGRKTLIAELDVRDQAQIEQFVQSIEDEWKQVDVLINNSGLALGFDSFHEADLEDWETMIDTNVKGLLYMSKAIAVLMIANKRGHIINIGSIAGKEVYPNGNVYCGTKHFVDSITRSMRMELLPFGIKVSQVAPGAVDTEFSLVRFKGDAERAAKVYQGFSPLSGDDVAEAISFILNRPEHVCINDLVIMPSAQASATIIKRD